MNIVSLSGVYLMRRKKKSTTSGVLGGGYATHELVYSVTGEFNPRVCSELLFRTKVEFAINDQRLKHAWTDKNYFEYFFPNEDFPVAIVRNIAGVFYDNAYNVITEEKAKNLIAKYEKYAIKPTIDNGFGKNVRMITRTDDINAVFAQYGRDYIIQEIMEQYAPIAELNPSSVNVIRLISLFVNGRVSPIMAALRCGAPGSFNDNCITADGRGMFVIGITEDGKLKDRAFHSCGEKISCAPNGANFTGMQIPNYESIKKLTSDVHSKLAHFGFIGFDIAIDKNGKPVIMEYNLRGPGVLYYQYVNGPLFGDRTDEIISIVKANSVSVYVCAISDLATLRITLDPPSNAI
jgi:hypothetical protein